MPVWQKIKQQIKSTDLTCHCKRQTPESLKWRHAYEYYMFDLIKMLIQNVILKLCTAL